jgi:hypothetical protein
MKHHYIINPSSEKGFEEVTETEWDELIGEKPYSQYSNQLYKSNITIEDIPEEYREKVQEIVNNKIAKWGTYAEQDTSAYELQNMIEEVL